MIVWIHGFPLSSAVFAKQAVIEGFAPDLAGFGSASPPARDYSMDDYARDVLAAIDRKQIDRAVFAGLSMGGYICMAIARIAPERMRGLILIDTRETADDERGKKGRYDTIARVNQEGVSVVVDSMLPKMLTPAAPQSVLKEARAIMSSSSREGVTAALRAMAERPDSTETLRQLRVPVLIAVGDSDSITPPSDAERMKALLSNVTLATIPGAAHLSNLERPEIFNKAVESFLTRHDL